MAFIRNTVALLALFSLLAIAASQSRPSKGQLPPYKPLGQIGRQIPENEPENELEEIEVNANLKNTDCDGTYKSSCSDCNTRLICKPSAVVYLQCPERRPHCNSGYCSGIPSSTCA